MTLEEMQQTTVNFWMTQFRSQASKMSKEEIQRQSVACARLTRQQMDDLKMIGLDEETAWTETRNLYCLAPPPKSDLSQTAQ